jgi:hypothetical protein
MRTWKDTARSVLSNRMTWIWLAVWLATRAVTVADIGFWGPAAHLRLEDVATYETWSQVLTTRHAFPGGPAWQYPPGAALVMLIPKLGPGTYGESSVGLMLLFDLAGLGLLALLGRRSGNSTGVWVWLLAMPLVGAYALLRFDLVPTVIAIAALVVVHRRPGWFGALVGVGAAIKVWPALLLFTEWDRRRLLRAGAAALAGAAGVVVVTALAFGDPFGFLSGQSDRGLQREAVATAPWLVSQIASGAPPALAVHFGSRQIVGSGADTVAVVLKWLSLASLAAAAAWWGYRARAIRRGWAQLADIAVSRDFALTVVLLLTVTSRVLSPQYMVWLLGLAAVVLSAGTARLARPAWIVVAATLLTTTVQRSPELLLFRNVALVVATIDAATAMTLLLRRGAPPVGAPKP